MRDYGFCERMHAAREARGVTQRPLAEMSGLSLSAVHSYEAGKAAPGAYALKSICAALRCSADWLLGLRR